MSKTNPFAPPPPTPDPVLAEIKGASELEDLAALYVEHHAAWTPEHTLAAAKQVLDIFAHERMRELDQHYHDGDYA